MDLHLNKKVLEDLAYLKENWTKGIDETSIRHSSHILRSLLVENDLMKVKNALNIKFRILVSNHKKLNDNENQDLNFFMPKGALFVDNPQITNMQVFNRALSDAEMTQLYLNGKTVEKSFVQINKFCKTIAFIIKGIEITKDELIKYVCNKMGGVHYDTKRSDKYLDKKYKLLDGIFKSVAVQSSNPIYSSIQGIGQDIVNSPDLDKFLLKLKENQPFDWRKNF
ncbi:MAG: hypothetical protein PF574_05670 [Candidatus Delongbacteria bacterium]|jgi:hypothetical protein|nr:hypothetical protein [Candidatus Delongbacteria bacterium]